VISTDCENGIVFLCKSEQSAQKSAITLSLQRITKQNWEWDISQKTTTKLNDYFFTCMQIKHLSLPITTLFCSIVFFITPIRKNAIQPHL